MITLRPSTERGYTEIDWLKSYHSFSFGDYVSHKHHHFRTLRVINEDFIAPGQGFAPHRHQDMEIITYIISGEIEHQDSEGNHSVIKRGEIQRMSAGSGITHSEYNPSKDEATHLLQIWIYPEEKSIHPSYAQQAFDFEKAAQDWLLLAGLPEDKALIDINQQARLYVTVLSANETRSFNLSSGKYAWLHLVKGEAEIGDKKLAAGDSASVSEDGEIKVTSLSEVTEILLFELA